MRNDDDNATRTEADAVADAVRASTLPQTIGLHSGSTERCSVLVVPNGHHVESVKPHLDEYRKAPERRKGTARFAELSSFIEHVNAFKLPSSVVFVDRALGMTAVLDYHSSGADGVPGFGEHRSEWRFPFSDELEAWKRHEGDAMSQGEFAEFLEQHICDVADPSALGGKTKDTLTSIEAVPAGPTKLMELSRGLQVHVDSKLTQRQTLQSGESTLAFTEEHKDSSGAPLKVPSAFVLHIPVFDGGDLYPVPVRLRYRIRDGRVVWTYLFHRIDDVVRAATDECVEQVGLDTGLPVWFGTPE